MAVQFNSSSRPKRMSTRAKTQSQSERSEEVSSTTIILSETPSLSSPSSVASGHESSVAFPSSPGTSNQVKNNEIKKVLAAGTRSAHNKGETSGTQKGK